MNKSYKKSSAKAMRLIVVMVIGLFSATAVQAKWSFGVIADNQDAAGLSHGLVATQTIHQIDSQFIAKGVKLVIQVGDELNAPQKGVHGDLAFAAAEAQYLYNAGIGFFPMRGNHEAQSDGGNSYLTINMFRNNFPQTQGGVVNIFGETNFSSPTLPGNFPDDLKGLSYSFDYFGDGGSARFLILDDWGTVKPNYDTRLSPSYPLGYSVGVQQQWISSKLDESSRGTDHAFVFAHHNLIGEDHIDCLFGNPIDSLDRQNAFLASLYNNNVKYFTSGHEHVYNRSIFTSPDGNSHVQDNNCAPAGPKFLVPISDMSKFSGQKERQMQISQEMNNIGFCIYTIDGPRVTVDYYSDANGGFSTWPDGQTPTFNFVKKETWGYSLNGKEYCIPESGSYAVISDTFGGTIAGILNGFNGCTSKDYEGRAFTKLITTGWSGGDEDQVFRSKILTLWGMADFGTEQTDVYTLQMTYKQGKTRHIDQGCFGIGTLDAQGNWVNAVDMNFGGAKTFVQGPWDASYGLGTYGIDPSTKTVWAVVNHAGDFVAKNDIEQVN